jgi:nucleoside diphosphate kinase
MRPLSKEKIQLMSMHLDYAFQFLMVANASEKRADYRFSKGIYDAAYESMQSFMPDSPVETKCRRKEEAVDRLVLQYVIGKNYSHAAAIGPNRGHHTTTTAETIIEAIDNKAKYDVISLAAREFGLSRDSRALLKVMNYLSDA